MIFTLHCLVCKLLMALLLDLMDCKAIIENDRGFKIPENIYT